LIQKLTSVTKETVFTGEYTIRLNLDIITINEVILINQENKTFSKSKSDNNNYFNNNINEIIEYYNKNRII